MSLKYIIINKTNYWSNLIFRKPYIIVGSISPTTVVQAEGLDTTFLCQLPTAGITIEWQINGISLRNVNAGGGQIRREGRGNNTEALIMTALPQFNGTSIVCILYIIELNGTVDFIESTPALLVVQGSSY